MLPTTLRLSFVALAFCIAFIPANAQQNKNTYDSLYNKAYRLGSTQPDSAIHYANLATRATSQSEEQANAHNLLAFYAVNQGYYALAIKRYQKAYDLYPQAIKKATMLKNIAFCYKNIGNYQAATPIAEKATQRYKQLQDSVLLMRSYNLLANCYRTGVRFASADSAYRLAIAIGQQQKHKDLAKIYDDYARLKERLNQYDSALYYQRLALGFNEKQPTNTVIRLSRMVQLSLLARKTDSAKYYLAQAQAIRHSSIKANIQLAGVRGMLHFIERQENKALQAYERCDSLLNKLKQAKGGTIQQKFVRKTAYEVYERAYQILDILYTYGNDKETFAELRQRFKKRMIEEKTLYEEIKIRVALRDSLVIACIKPNTQVQIHKQIAPWWWVVMVATLAIAAIWVYKARSQAANARAQEAQVHVDFVAAIEASPVKGIGHISKAEASMLAEIEHRQKNKLTPDEIKLFLLVVRGYTYKTIAVQTVFTEGNIKTKVRRAKKACGVDSLKELM